MLRPRPCSSLLLAEIIVFVALCSSPSTTTTIRGVTAWVPPTLGIGAVFLPVPTDQLRISESSNPRLDVQDVGDFFVDSFWTAKVGGGARTLSPTQRRSLQSQQAAEFSKRYGGRRLAELIVLRNRSKTRQPTTATTATVATAKTTIACVGVEVDRIPQGGLKGPTWKQAPLMSNLAVARQYRRRGLAERLVQAVEDVVRREWGYDECFLYVEERNRGALQLYRKLGYRIVWRDATAQTLLPTPDGSLNSASTVMVCMRKNLNANFVQRLFGS